MRPNVTRDFIVGLFVLAGLAAIAYLSLGVAGLHSGGGKGLSLFATFDQVAGLKPRAPVEISGVKVGQVVGIRLNDEYRARVDIDIDSRLELPLDSSAAIVTAGILGDKYITLELGGETEYLKSGEEIPYTESAVVLERLIGKFLYNVGSDKK